MARKVPRARVWSAALAAAATVAAAAPAEAAPSRIAWSKCYGTLQCGTLQVPLDHSRKGGATISLALIRRPADDPSQRIGSLFLNPGGPGGSGVEFTRYLADILFTEDVRARYDLVGFDPRGIAGSTALRCYGDERQWRFAPFPYPTTPDEEAAYEAADRKIVADCERRGGAIASHMSTANVARDLELLRRAVGDEQLHFAGYSYGSYLGATYASLFPERVGRMVVDGVLDPVAWSTGTGNQSTTLPFSTRLGSATGAQATLEQFFAFCDGADEKCAFSGDAADRYAALVERLTAEPLTLTNPDGSSQRFGRAELIGTSLGAMYDYFRWPAFAEFLAAIEDAAGPVAQGAAAQQFMVRARYLPKRGQYPYYNGIEGFPAVACTDSDSPDTYGAWHDAAAGSPGYFGPLWTWITSICAPWSFTDAGRFMGPFTADTAHPVLVVGNRYDPATPYHGAERLAELLPGAALLTLEAWGHTSLFYSSCADAAIERYLLDGDTPAPGTTCTADVPPFAG